MLLARAIALVLKTLHAAILDTECQHILVYGIPFRLDLAEQFLAFADLVVETAYDLFERRKAGHDLDRLTVWMWRRDLPLCEVERLYKLFIFESEDRKQGL